MMAGVMTLVLAAATAVLPFTPPPAWVQLPQSAVGVHVSNVWKGPKSAHGEASSFSAVAFPFPGTVDLLASGGSRAARHTNLMRLVSKTSLQLCGVPARMLVERVQAAGVSSVLEQEVAVKNGYGYMLMYTRPSGAPADARVTQAMHEFCPSGTGTIAALQLPSGWTKSAADLQTVGVWMGTQPGQIMMLMRGSQMSSLDQVFNSVQHESTTAKSGKSIVKVTLHKAVTMCGLPGLLADMSITAGPAPAAMHVAITQGDGASYVLTYMQMGTSPADPAAMAALQTLCAAGASPVPSPSASASASPAPAATP